MDKWRGKVAVVTGASSGIGASLAVALVEAGMQVVGLARRADAIEVSANIWRQLGLAKSSTWKLLTIEICIVLCAFIVDMCNVWTCEKYEQIEMFFKALI